MYINEMINESNDYKGLLKANETILIAYLINNET